MEKNTCGIVSYAGLSRETLISRGKAIFAQAQPPVPKRFEAFLPLFPLELIQNMGYVGTGESRGQRASHFGFSIDPTEYHRKLYAQLPELYADDNYLRNFDYEGHFSGRGVFTVDRVWADHFPQYQAFLGEKLMIHLIGGGCQAVAVPESVYPRGGGVLRAAEEALEITQRAELFVQYARARISAGDAYDADAFTLEYLHTTGLTVVSFTQAELSRVLQDLSIANSVQNDTVNVGLYTENARRAERVNQYVPMRYACDLFTAEAVDKHTVRLVQLCNADSDYISDLWIPYQGMNAYLDRRTQTLDVRRLCEGYQIAPRYDAETGGGRYPDAARVVMVRDRDLQVMVGEVINNPAYGDGMGPQGIIGRQVYIADSREMIRQRKLTLEELPLTCDDLTLPPAEYRRGLMLAVLQEHKGRLVDAMYRRETVLSQINLDTPAYEKACELLNDRVERIAAVVRQEASHSGMSQMSGYDADIDYLRRMQRDREGEPEEAAKPTGKPIAFARDMQREQSIESGYAMRAGLIRMAYADAALPDAPPEPDIPREPERPDIPAPTAEPESAEDSGARQAPAPEPETPATRPNGTGQDTPLGTEAEDARSAPMASDETSEGAAAPQLFAVGELSTEAERQSESAMADRDGEQEESCIGDPDTEPVPPRIAVLDAAAEDCRTADASGADPLTEGADPLTEGAGLSLAPPPQGGDTDEDSSDAIPRPDHFTRADELPVPTASENVGEVTAEGLTVNPTDAGGAADAPAENDMDGEDGASCPDPALYETARRRRVSLRELTDRMNETDAFPTVDPEATTAVRASAEPEKAEDVAEKDKPKLAYILRRGSEGAATQSYNRMSDMLNKRRK